jgi:hypothetical protein
MIFVVAPEPAWWLAPHVRRDKDTRVFAPWATRLRPPSFLPDRLRAFFSRRQLDGAVTVPGWQLGEGLARWWAGTHAERKLRVRFAVRNAVDHLAAGWVLRLRPDVVVAPACGARRAFAAAHRIGAKTILLEDLPDIRGMHRDLDRAARVHPACSFLNRYRAPATLLARQEAERVLADEILVRGRFARQERIEAGIDPKRIGALPEAAATPMTTWLGDRPRVLLAGLAAARHGTLESLAAVEQLGDVDLLIRAGEGMEPRDLLAHPRVIRDDGQGANAVIAPTWCEAYPPEVARAVAAGIPIIATRRAAGFADVRETPVGDIGALAREIRRAVA